MVRSLHLRLLVIGFGLTVILARLDNDATSIADVFQLQNIPAFIIYTLLFYVFMLGGVTLARAIRRGLGRAN